MTTPAAAASQRDADRISRAISVEGDVRLLGHMKKEASIRGFFIMCDEREPMGSNSAPSPLAYFASCIIF